MTFDPELDMDQSRPRLDSSEPVEDFQRLVANPFLAVLAWIAGFWLMNLALTGQNVALFLFGVSLLLLAFFLLQYHCLDCGGTGSLLRSWTHACSAVVARRQSGRPRRFRGPGLRFQLVAWFILILAALVLGAALLAGADTNPKR